MITRALIINEAPLSRILSGVKTWEMRKRNTHRRGPIALIEKGSGMIVGTAIVTDCRTPLGQEEYAKTFRFHRIVPAEQQSAFQEGYRIPWVLQSARRLRSPIPYRHPPGAQVWVTLSWNTVQKLPRR